MRYKNLILIGTSHIAKQSIKEIEQAFTKYKPKIVAVELDHARYKALIQRRHRKPRLRDIRKVGLKGFLFGVVGSYIQKKLGKYVGVEPGSDMLTAIKLAKKHKARLALIDQPIEITLSRFSMALTWRERWNFLVDIFLSIFFGKREMKKLGIKKLDLRKVPPKKVVNKLIGHLKKRYPNIYRVLIDERNQVMALNLAHLMQSFPDDTLLAVVGAGHEKELLDMIKDRLSITYSFSVG